MAKAAYYMVTESFIGMLDGEEVEYHKGEVVSTDDPAVTKMAAHFAPLVVRGVRPAVEQATAAPGEQRDVPVRSALTTDSFRPRPRGS
jgi:hypothetical protein